MKKPTKKSKKKIALIILTCLMLAVIVTTLATRLLRQQVDERFGSQLSQEVLTAQVTTGSISTTAAGSGMLQDDDVETVEIPQGVEIKTVLVSRGDTVAEGDILATVNTSTVISAMEEKQEQLDELDDELQSAKNETVGSTITAGLTGRVKAIYAGTGDDVASVMYDKDALMLLSLDGNMAAQLETAALEPEDEVTVVLSDGTEKDGTVAEADDGVATILVTDNGPELGETVTILDDSGVKIGTAELAIHKSLKVTGYAGTVSGISVSENQKVSAGQTLLTLTDTGYTASFDSILRERETLEEDLQDLIQIYQEGAILAPISGTVGSVDYDPDREDDAESEETEAENETLLTLRPDDTMTLTVSIDESDILALEIGQEVAVTVDSIEDETFTGTVLEIDTTGTSSGGVTTYTAEISVPKAEGMLGGMSATATIQIQGVENALLIPADALHKTSSTAYVYTGSNAETGELTGMVEVTIGISNGKYVEITSGLKEGDTVYYTESQENAFAFPMPGGNQNQGGMDWQQRPGDDSRGGMQMPGGGMPGSREQ
ncbi:MAG: HlyD family efflux transporter periplasmic adaptor subunit [Eubacteriales bacterium]|nr:HlyD family efflux transporter periplasmic adaptor subunit [Eubacteriales bacterium]